MDKEKYYKSQKNKSKCYLSSINKSLKSIDNQLISLEQSKKKTDNMINKLEIECYKYNLVDEMYKSKKNLEKNLIDVNKKIVTINDGHDKNITKNSLKKVAFYNDVLDKSSMQLHLVCKDDFSKVEKLQMNAIKKGIYSKFMLLKSEVDRSRILDQINKVQIKSKFTKAIVKFFDFDDTSVMKKENLYMMIYEIDQKREELLKNYEPDKEYKIMDIYADIQIFLDENQYDSKYKRQTKEIIKLRNMIDSIYSIDKYRLKSVIMNKQRNNFPIEVNKRMNRMRKAQIKTAMFLSQNGYINEKIENESNNKMVMAVKKLDNISKNIEVALRSS